MGSNNKEVKSLVKTARWIFAGIFVQASLFAFWGLGYFINTTENAPSVLWPTIVFYLLGIASYFYGVRFFQNYTTFRNKEILLMEVKKRKESLLLVTVIHLLILEFICVLGITLSIFLQKTTTVIPFYIVFIGGMLRSIPREYWFEPFFTDPAAPADPPTRPV